MATPPKKDPSQLTEFEPLDLSQSISSPPAFSSTEEQPFEKVEEFESLDQFQISESPPPSGEWDLPSSQLPSLNLESAIAEPITPEPELNPVEVSLPDAPLTIEPSPDPKSSIQPPNNEKPLARDPSHPGEAMQLLREFAENIPVGKPPVQASFPFTLMIKARFSPEEREKFVDVITRENMGINPTDLEPQFESGKILIPRISEYAAVVLTQAMRSIRGEIRIGPSDEMYSSEATREPLAPGAGHSTPQSDSYMQELGHPAEKLPVTNLPTIPGFPHYTVIEVLTASAALETRAIEAEASTEYQELLEALQNQIRFKAYSKGAAAVLNYQVKLVPLGMPTHYRVTVSGTAIRTPPKPII